MEDKKRETEQQASPPTGRGGLGSYGFLVRLSERMGTIATRSIVEVRGLLQRDGLVSPTERFISGMSRLRLQRRPSEASTSKSTTKKDTVRPEADLETIISQSHEVLAEANTVFPMTLFPDTVLVDRTKVTIIRRDFFWVSDTMTFRIEDVLNAEVSVGPLFGSLTIASRVMSTTDHFRINYFWRNDAVRLKQIIQGYIIARHNDIDTAHLTKDELIHTLSELGDHRR